MRQIQVQGTNWLAVVAGGTYVSPVVKLGDRHYVARVWLEKKAGLCIRLEDVPRARPAVGASPAASLEQRGI